MFRRVRSVVPMSEFMRTYPVCAALLRRDWSKNVMKQRAEICRHDLPHLAARNDEGQLSRREVGFLLNCIAGTADLKMCPRPRRRRVRGLCRAVAR